MVPVRSARLSAGLVWVLVLGAATGCTVSEVSEHEAPARVAESAPASGAPAGGDVAHRRLPVEDYLMSPAENDRVERARSALIGACMKRFGFDFTPRTPDYKKMSGQVSNRYGPTDTKAAAARGYHPDRQQMSEGAETSQKSLSKDMKAVLGGGDDSSGNASSRTEKSYRGILIPEGGCSGESDRTLTTGGGLIQDAEAAVAVNFDSFDKSAADRRVRKAFAEWSTCMKEKKFSYATPLEAINDQRWRTDEPSAAEIATAVAEVECKQRYDVVGVWFSVESSYQRADIKAKAHRMAEIREGIDVAFKNAASVVGE